MIDSPLGRPFGFFAALFSLALLGVAARSQTLPSTVPDTPPPTGRTTSANMDLRENILRRDPSLRSADRSAARRVESLLNSVWKEVNRGVVVGPEDAARYEAFLKSPDAGIFKPLPLAACGALKKSKDVVRCRLKNDMIARSAGAYSFFARRYDSRLSGDVALTENSLSARETDVQTIIVDLGEASFEALTVDSAGVAYLRDFKPATKINEVKAQFDLFYNGLSVGGYRYSKFEPLRPNGVYALRAVGYAGNTFLPKATPSDVIVALKLVRYETDGTPVLIWKRLASAAAPTLDYDSNLGVSN